MGVFYGTQTAVFLTWGQGIRRVCGDVLLEVMAARGRQCKTPIKEGFATDENVGGCGGSRVGFGICRGGRIGAFRGCGIGIVHGCRFLYRLGILGLWYWRLSV